MSLRKSAVLWIPIVLIGVGLRILFVLLTPIDKPVTIGELSSFNDERAHVEYTRSILLNAKLPERISPITDASEVPTYENYQSPAFYLVHAAICSIFGLVVIEQVTLSGRFISLLFGVVLIWVAWSISLALHLSEPSRVIVLSFLSLSGVFVRFSAVAGNDAMFWCLIGLFAWYMLRFERNTRATEYALLLFVFVLSVYTKLSALILLPPLLWKIYKARLPIGLATAGLALAVLGLAPLFFRNIEMFGSLVPLSTGFGQAAWRVPDLSSLLYAVRSFLFPWSELWSNWLGFALMLPALICFAILLVAWSRTREYHDWRVMLAAIAVLAFVLLNFRFDQAEARYLFAAWPFVFSLAESAQTSASLPIAFSFSLCLPYCLFLC